MYISKYIPTALRGARGHFLEVVILKPAFEEIDE